MFNCLLNKDRIKGVSSTDQKTKVAGYMTIVSPGMHIYPKCQKIATKKSKTVVAFGEVLSDTHIYPG